MVTLYSQVRVLLPARCFTFITFLCSLGAILVLSVLLLNTVLCFTPITVLLHMAVVICVSLVPSLFQARCFTSMTLLGTLVVTIALLALPPHTMWCLILMTVLLHMLMVVPYPPIHRRVLSAVTLYLSSLLSLRSRS